MTPMKVRSIKMSDENYQKCVDLAELLGMTFNTFVNSALKDYASYCDVELDAVESWGGDRTEKPDSE